MKSFLAAALALAAFCGECAASDDTSALAAAADKGDAKAQYQLGYDYIWGTGVRKNTAKAVELWRKSADQGYAPAEFMMGSAYENGEWVKRSDDEAIKWDRKAADQNYGPAMFTLAYKYQRAKTGLVQDRAKAQELFKASIAPLRYAAEKGDVMAECNLSKAYLEGLGVPKDKGQGLKWAQEAAAHGNPLGETILALIYQKGWGGVPQDSAKAVEWFGKAAEHNSDLAQLELGKAYWWGIGMPTNNLKAYVWFDIAASQGRKEAGPMLIKVAKVLTYEQLQEATKQSEDWQRQHLAGK